MKPGYAANSSISPAIFRRVTTVVLFLAAVLFSCFVLYRGAESAGFTLPTPYHRHNYFPPTTSIDSRRTDITRYLACKVFKEKRFFTFWRFQDREEYSLESILKEAAMQDRTVILTTLNEAWASPNSIIDLFLESFRIGEHTRVLLNHLVIIALDQKAFLHCVDIHTHCFALTNEGVNFSREAYFMTPVYLEMMWSRIHFLQSVLELGFNFVFTDADIMWFRDPFLHFHSDADFQIASDHFTGKSDDLDNIPNGGFKFVRSNSRSIEFYKFWYLSRERHPGLHDQDVLSRIKNDTRVQDIGLRIRFLDTAYFGGFCEPSKDLNQVCTMHANCCFGLGSKLHDLRILLEDWKTYMSLPPRLKGSSLVSWSVPQNCSLDAFIHVDVPAESEMQLMEYDSRLL